MAKATKSTKKFAKSKLKGVIKDRKAFKKKNAPILKAKKDREFKQLKRGRGRDADSSRGAGDDDAQQDSDDDDDDSDDGEGATPAMTVDDFLGGGFRQGMGDGSDDDDEDLASQDEDYADDEELIELDDVEDEEINMREELAKMAQKDPDFYKFLQDNDKELLNFGREEETADDDEEEDNEGGADEDEEMSEADEDVRESSKEQAVSSAQPITNKILTQWKKAMIQSHSVRSLRKLLLAFRSAARVGSAGANDDADLAYSIESASMFNNVVMTTVRFTPVVLQHHLPYKSLANGKFKLPTNDKKYAMLQAAVKSFASNLVYLLKTMPDQSMVLDVVTQSSKMIPYLMPIRKSARDYLNTLINLWSTGQDDVRISAFLAVRKAALAGDPDFLDHALRSTYRGLVNSCKQTTIHNLPSINLMKNSATELFAIDSTASYQHAFGYIRQLAIHLRQTLKNTRSKESRQAVCSWQYVHCLDFWSLVLSQACDVTVREEKGESVMQPLIYPLVQVAMGVMRLVPSSAYIPLRIHILRSMTRLVQRTGVYIPLYPFFTQLFDSAEFQASPKGSTLKPLDLDTTLRASDAYVRTRVYADQVAEEVGFLFIDFLASQARSIAFPEMVIPLLVQVKRQLKSSANPKLVSSIKAILEKTAQNSTWVATKRASVDFAPNSPLATSFLANEKGEAPLESALRLARKVRDQKRKLLEQTRQEGKR
ncbi:Nucleolar Complex 2 protein [Tilletia horrida]|uniref:Nucleolar Complex 2 protein n=1 Tax=Tilletia horrida TaxID=155126 RepID=A0AAN6GTR6_9BASI|nr:Nucleolar Complex 2 protein [Tilletia horrida]KAK0564251.1 Nucleolar Complex 2 protein [Tilletia horrida]